MNQKTLLRMGTIVVGMVLLSACTAPNPPTLVPTEIAVFAPTSTPTVAPTATKAPSATPADTPTHTPTATSTATSEPTATSTPTATITPRVTTTPRNTATPKPTQVPATATTAPSAVFVPPPQVFQFDVGAFMKYLEFAHKKYQDVLKYVGGAAKGDYVGNCRYFGQFHDDMLGIVAFTNVPDQWKAMVDEYHALRTEAIIATDPINQICHSGGGTVSDETDRHATSVLDRAQNRMYEMLQQAKAMIQ